MHQISPLKKFEEKSDNTVKFVFEQFNMFQCYHKS